MSGLLIPCVFLYAQFRAFRFTQEHDINIIIIIIIITAIIIIIISSGTRSNNSSSILTSYNSEFTSNSLTGVNEDLLHLLIFTPGEGWLVSSDIQLMQSKTNDSVNIELKKPLDNR